MSLFFQALPARRLLGLAAALALFFAGQTALFGEISAPGSIVPLPVPVKVEVKRGGVVEITLGISGRQDEAVTFKLRSRPRYGKLSELKMVSGSVGVLTYRHAGDLEHLGDEFTYAVQTDQGVSAPASVEITVTDDPPIFTMPDKIEFGEVVLGSTVKKEFTLSNDGSGVLDGVMDPDKPFTIGPNQNYHLGPGVKQLFTIEFTPGEAGDARGEIRYSSFPARVTSLHASGKPPFSVEPEAVELRHAKNDPVRTGAFHVTNETDAAEKVEIALPARLQGPKEVELAANETKRVAFATLPGDAREIEDSVAVSMPVWKRTVTVQSRALGPMLQAAPEAVTFDQTKIGVDMTASLTVKNTGGSQALVRLTVQTPFEVSEEDAGFSLDPGQERSVSILLAAGDPGNFRSFIRIDAAGADIEVPVQGKVVEEPAPPAPPLPAYLATGSPAPASAAAGRTPPAARTRAVARVRVARLGSDTCDLVWSAPAPGDLHYHVEMRTLSLDEHRDLRIDWVPIPDVSISISGDRTSARLAGLTPQYPYAVRVHWIDSKGDLSAPSATAYFTTKAKWHPKLRPLPVLVVALTVMIGLIIRQRFFQRVAA